MSPKQAATANFCVQDTPGWATGASFSEKTPNPWALVTVTHFFDPPPVYRDMVFYMSALYTVLLFSELYNNQCLHFYNVLHN